MVQCNSCGYKNIFDAKFCTNCGKKLEKTSQYVVNNQNVLSNNKKRSSRSSSVVKIIIGLVGICCVGAILLLALGSMLPDETLSDSPGTLSDSLVKVSYPNPTNDYEKSVNELSKYATVYEGDTGDPNALGVTHREKYGDKIEYIVIIAEKDQFVVYHELAHVLHWGWSEYNCDWYAYNRTGYWV